MKTIDVGHGKRAMIDDCDYADLGNHRWHLTSAKRPASWIKGKSMMLHRLVFLRCRGYLPREIDHVNGNYLDNRRENLREASRNGQMWNQGKHRNNKSGYKGVWWEKNKAKYVCVIRALGKRHHLGYFDDPKIGALAYDAAARKLHGKYARTNF